MKTSLLRKNQNGFTLIEIIAVLVILGILAAVAIPKYLDMRTDAITNAAKGAISELNARERLYLAQSKLKDATASGYYSVDSYDLGEDWVTVSTIATNADTGGSLVFLNFKGKKVTFTKTATTDINIPAQWKLTSVE